MKILLALSFWISSIFIVPPSADICRATDLEKAFSLEGTVNGVGVVQFDLEWMYPPRIECHAEGRSFSKVPDLAAVKEVYALGVSQPHAAQPDDALPNIFELERVSLTRSSSDLRGDATAVEISSLPDRFGSKVGRVSGKYNAQGGEHTNEQRNPNANSRQQQVRPADRIRDEPLMSRLPLGAQFALLAILGSLAYWPGLAGLVLIGFGWEERRFGLGIGLVWLGGLSFMTLMWACFGSPW